MVIKGGRITTSGTQTYGENVLLDNAARVTVLNTTDANLTFLGKLNNQVSGTAQSLQINTGAGAVMFTDTLGDAGKLGALEVNSTGVTTFTQAVDASSLQTNAGGSVVIKGGRITTSGVQTYGEKVVITRATTLGASDVSLSDAVVGDGLAAHNLTVVARIGNANFGAEVGSALAPVGVFKVEAANETVFNELVTVAHLETGTTGITRFNTPKVLTTSNASMVFGNDVVVPGSFTFDTTNEGRLSTGADITFNKTLSSANAGASEVLIQAGTNGKLRLLGAVGKDAAGTRRVLKSFTVNAGGGIVIGGGYVETTGLQSYRNPIELSASVDFLADTLTWGRITSIAPNVGLRLATPGAQILTDISISGSLDVTTGQGNQQGGVTQAQGNALQIGGTTSFTAHTKTAQVAQLNNTGNRFDKALSFLTSNGGSWGLVDAKSEQALVMGATTVDGDIILKSTSGDISQVDPLNIRGTTNLQAVAGKINFENPLNVFVESVTVETPQSLKISATGPLTMDKVKVGQDTELKSSGKLNLGTGNYSGKLVANSGGFEIEQSGPINFFGDTNFDAGNAKIEIFNPYNQWRGGIMFRGGIILINHPVLMNAVNAGTLNVRATSTLSLGSTPTTAGVASSSLQPLAAKAPSGPAVTVMVDKPTSGDSSAMITVALSTETAAPGRSFSFELDPKVVTQQPANTSLKISQLDGKALPDWLKYEPDTKTFTAKDVPAGAFPLQLKVMAGGQETMMVIQEQDARR